MEPDADAETYLCNVTRILQITQTVIDGRETDRRQICLRRSENFARGEVLVGILYDLKHGFPLLGQS